MNCTCGGDNIDCYRAAQLELLHIVAGSDSGGCAVILTGDFHFSDIKILQTGNETSYSDIYQSARNPRPVYQIMASGMSDSTAKPAECDSFRLDPLGLRTHKECEFVTGPSFGRVIKLTDLFICMCLIYALLDTPK